MRLLRTDGDIPVLKTFNDERHLPKYAILSHTWMADEDEVTFSDLQDIENAKLKPGWKKIAYSRDEAKADGLDWIWIDTCCIDKSSSAELTEAINSMFRWYQNAEQCFAYLADMPDLGYGPASIVDPTEDWDWQAFERCKWFSRGWTLQEMLAPPTVHLFSMNWQRIGQLEDLSEQVSAITGIDVEVLQIQKHSIRGKRDKKRMLLRSQSVAKRMSWAARRSTTRIEDEAYSLLGIFSVNMPVVCAAIRKPIHFAGGIC